ncbi:MAG: hypothetical protein RIR51_962 [Bacteroidota bacterium]|jgi:nicotinate-nucleotide pyrophosphorylase (carboxylating)
MYNYLNPDKIQEFIQFALMEDVGSGDYTSLSTIPETKNGMAKLIVKEAGILAGLDLSLQIFNYVDSNFKIEIFKRDGDFIQIGDIVLEVEGNAQSLLKAERLVLNCMQRMSGIATYTRKLVNILEGTKAKLLDTRKTTPNFRIAEKWACKIGGAVNHRYGLFDMILIKDNHVDFAGGIKNAIIKSNEYNIQNNLNLPIEIEVRNFKELEEVLEIGKIDRIMLDNFSPSDLRDAIRKINGRFTTEASGGITEQTLRLYGETGVDFISVGALTHQIKSLDLSLKAKFQ